MPTDRVLLADFITIPSVFVMRTCLSWRHWLGDRDRELDMEKHTHTHTVQPQEKDPRPHRPHDPDPSRTQKHSLSQIRRRHTFQVPPFGPPLQWASIIARIMYPSHVDHRCRGHRGLSPQTAFTTYSMAAKLVLAFLFQWALDVATSCSMIRDASQTIIGPRRTTSKINGEMHGL